MKFFACFLVVAISIRDGTPQSWNYQNFDAWGALSKTCTQGSNQSPIDLRADLVGPKDGRPHLEFLNYRAVPLQVSLQNNGHTVAMSCTWNRGVPSIKGPYVLSNQVFHFNSLHLHWSEDDNDGTEHSIEQEKYAAELHLVHYNGKYDNFSVAASKPDGLAVVGILFEVDNSVAPNLGMEHFVSAVQSVTNPGSSVKFRKFPLSSFLPNPIGSFYSYSGSLTTSPCSENVRWIVLSKPQPITSEIMRGLRNVNLDQGDTFNVRPIQEQNTRLVQLFE